MITTFPRQAVDEGLHWSTIPTQGLATSSTMLEIKRKEDVRIDIVFRECARDVQGPGNVSATEPLVVMSGNGMHTRDLEVRGAQSAHDHALR